MNRTELLAIGKPILFNTPMVQAVRDGRKTVTRRVVKPQPDHFYNCVMGESRPVRPERYGAVMPDKSNRWIKLPYHPGDILYVRETFFREECTQDCAGQLDPNECPFNRVGDSCYGYKTQYIDSTGEIKWHPSIHMPKEAARLFLRVTGVRVERLQDISLEDAISEGAVKKPQYVRYGGEKCLVYHGRYKKAFFNLWDSTIKPVDLPLYGGDANPWVWVIEFERVIPE